MLKLGYTQLQFTINETHVKSHTDAYFIVI